MPCLSYTVHLTLYTLPPRIKNIFYVFFFISRRAYIYVYLPSSHARVRTLFIYARSLHAAGPKQPLGYTREAYTPLGI